MYGYCIKREFISQFMEGCFRTGFNPLLGAHSDGISSGDSIGLCSIFNEDPPEGLLKALRIIPEASYRFLSDKGEIYGEWHNNPYNLRFKYTVVAG
jgi:hypothetical protein